MEGNHTPEKQPLIEWSDTQVPVEGYESEGLDLFVGGLRNYDKTVMWANNKTAEFIHPEEERQKLIQAREARRRANGANLN